MYEIPFKDHRKSNRRHDKCVLLKRFKCCVGDRDAVRLKGYHYNDKTYFGLVFIANYSIFVKGI